MENVMLFTSLMYITATSWYADAPVGVHVLKKKTVRKLFKQAGFSGQFTNHSLRTATRLYDAGVDEQLIAEKLGIGHLPFGHTRELKMRR